jgi:hypothetical protein
MKVKFTYKEFTLLVGVLVALIIMLTLWLSPSVGETGAVSRKLIPSIGKPSAKTVVEKTAVLINNFLR